MNLSTDLFLDFHAHQQVPAEGEIVIQSKFLHENFIANEDDKIFFTAGLHPWHADKLHVTQIRNKLHGLVQSNSIIAIGETGLDKIKGTDLETQLKAFKIHIDIANQYKLPLIIHSVKAHNEILKLKIDSKSQVPWVIHHFNGSKQAALNFIDHGFYLSICHHINNPHSKLSKYFSELPIERIFLETDDFDIDIQELYKIASQKFKIKIDLLKTQLIQNLKNLLDE